LCYESPWLRFEFLKQKSFYIFIIMFVPCSYFTKCNLFDVFLFKMTTSVFTVSKKYIIKVQKDLTRRLIFIIIYFDDNFLPWIMNYSSRPYNGNPRAEQTTVCSYKYALQTAGISYRRNTIFTICINTYNILYTLYMVKYLQGNYYANVVLLLIYIFYIQMQRKTTFRYNYTYCICKNLIFYTFKLEK